MSPLPDPEKLSKIIEKLERAFPLGRTLKRKKRRRRPRIRVKPQQLEEPSQTEAVPPSPVKESAVEAAEVPTEVPISLEPRFKHKRGVCVECGTALSQTTNYFTCSTCKKTVCTDCEREHVAKCWYLAFGGQPFGGEQ